MEGSAKKANGNIADAIHDFAFLFEESDKLIAILFFNATNLLFERRTLLEED